MAETMKTRVLLTGANGFLGTQIARQLIYLPEIEIIAMVRAKDKETARLRLERSWYDWGELQEALNDRVTVIPGDVTLEDLGMADEDYQNLVLTLTHIIHTVADLRLHAPLEDLRKTNVEGTRNLLKLAVQAQENGIFKRFSHLSTAYVAGKREGLILEDPEFIPKVNFNEANEANVNQINEVTTDFWSNYEESKYEAEQAVLKSGVPYSIFRPGMVVGDSETGDIKTFNTVYALFKLYLNGKLRFIPTSSNLTLNMVPVDYVAHAVGNLTFNREAEGKTFHLTAPQETLPTISQLLEQVRIWAQDKLDLKLPQPIFIPVAPLIQRISARSSRPQSGILNTLFTLAPYLNEKHTFSRDNINNFLGDYNLKWEEYLPHILEYAVYHGFFHRSERTVHEQVLYRLGSRSYPVKYYDITPDGVQEKSAAKMREDIISSYNSLKESGVGRGDRVALVGLNSTRYLTLEVAIGLLGAVSVPLYYTSPPKEIENILKTSKAKILFVGTPHLMKRLSELDISLEMISFCRESQSIPSGIVSWSEFLKKGKDHQKIKNNSLIQAPVDFGDLATIRYTSGTTGTPKGVTFNQEHLRWMAESMASLPPWKDRNREVRYLSFLPMNHVVEGILGTFSPYYAPAPLKIYFLEDFGDLASALPQAKPTIFFSVPRFYEKLWSQLKNSFMGSHYIHLKPGIRKKILKPVMKRLFLGKAGLDHCSQLIVGSATSSQHLILDYHSLGVEIHNAYGLTEAPLVTLNRRGANRIGTVGEPLPETNIIIARDGEVLVKGPQVTPGYFESDVTPPKKGGWLQSGDIGFITPEGSLVITGRKKELIINSYGKSIDPLRIEALLRNAPGTSEVMLVGEGKPYLIALIWVEDDYDPLEIERTIHKINQDLSHPEQVKRWGILPNDLSIDGGDLTANMKLKREIITQRYQDVIDALYQGAPNPLILHLGQLEAANGN
ncbi:AMP-binding protein [Methanobacterium formicicum]|uniref:Long-chain-fatty-acid--CoA ligase n=1 Tax=Methanobacterium formicicum (strain DSM 3637 / PP1) TaxID=1204725 RepID=K2QEY3_METFP|nr:AMP-binding protein [Methanobacterium formicicum]EKF86656.1 long-chain-fatty-acid--CoA ligase [Methanobacterium formicicum DSM 3637]